MHEDIVQELASRVADGRPCALATIVRAQGSIPNGVGAKMLVGTGGELIAGTVGGGAIEHQVLQAAAQALAEGRPRLVEAKLTEQGAGGIGMMCGGQVEVFVDVFRRRDHLLLLGGGHINVHLARLGAELGYRVTVVDDREAWANRQLYPDAVVLVRRPEEALPELDVDAHTYIVIATRDRDLLALEAAARTDARYIGVVASKRKAIQLVKQLGTAVDLELLLPRLRAPIGLELGGRSPEEIALSIAAEIQRERHGATGEPKAVSSEALLGFAKERGG